MDLLGKIKQTLNLENDQKNDALIQRLIKVAVEYAEAFQSIPAGSYNEENIPRLTEQAIILLAVHLYKKKITLSSNISFHSKRSKTQIMSEIDELLLKERNWTV